MYSTFILLLVLLTQFIPRLVSPEVSIQVERDVTDLNLEGKTTCKGEVLTITLTDEYRAYCIGTCYTQHYAYAPKLSRIKLRAPIPVPNPTTGQYDIVRHVNYMATCSLGTELIDFEYVNATVCKCKKVLVKYIPTRPPL